MSYDDPSQGHREAIKQLSESRATVRHYLRQLNADGGSTGVHPNLVAADKTPTEYSIATAALVDYLLQLRPYRDSSAAWNEGLGSVALPETFTGNPDVFGESGGSTYEIQIDPVQEFPSLSHVINIASRDVVYQERVQNPYLGHDKIPNGSYDDVDGEKRLYQFVLTTEQLRQIFERADEVAGAMGFLAEMDMPDHAAGGSEAV
jgi:hypothetical protein